MDAQMEAGRAWERDGIAVLRKLGFEVRRFGQENIFDQLFLEHLKNIVPHCRIRNIPDAIAVSGNLWFLVDFKTATQENSNSNYWAIGKQSLDTMVGLSDALICNAFFYFSDGSAVSAKKAKEISAAENGTNNGTFILINKKHCKDIKALLFPVARAHTARFGIKPFTIFAISVVIMVIMLKLLNYVF